MRYISFLVVFASLALLASGCAGPAAEETPPAAPPPAASPAAPGQPAQLPGMPPPNIVEQAKREDAGAAAR